MTSRLGRAHAAVLAAVLAASTAAGVAVLGSGSAEAGAPQRTASVVDVPGASVRYVALGDSYTSAPGVTPVATDAPPACGRSAVNYPHLVAAALGAELVDVSCGGARTKDFRNEQLAGVAPQLDVLGADTTLVSVGIGGNDQNLFGNVLAGCSATAIEVLAGSTAPCKQRYGTKFSADIAAIGTAVRGALSQVRKEAPNARVVVVGYPALFPSTTAGQLACVAAGIPFTPEDVEFLDGVERALNATLAEQADAVGVEFLDTYTPSVGHDMCRLPGVRWIEPLIPLAPAAPVHPNAAGQRAVADALVALVRARS